MIHFLSFFALVQHSILPAQTTFEDSSFSRFNRYSNRQVLVVEGNIKPKTPIQCSEGTTKFNQKFLGKSSLILFESDMSWSDTFCIRLARPSDSDFAYNKLFANGNCAIRKTNCIQGRYLNSSPGWSSLKSYHGCRSTSAEYTGSADFALNLNDSLALAVTVTAIAGGKHLGTHFLDSIPEDQNPIYTAEISTSRMLCAPGKKEPFHNSERKQFHFGTYPQFRLFRMGGKGILVMRGLDRQDPSRNRVIETTIDLYGMLQSRQYFDKSLPDGKWFPYADYRVEDGILYRKILDPQSANATVMDQGWVGLWVDRLLVPDYLRADSVARAQEDSLERTKTHLKALP